MTQLRTLSRLGTVALLMGTLTACNTLSRLSEVGQGPQPTPITNPVKKADYQPVTMPMPAPQVQVANGVTVRARSSKTTAPMKSGIF